MAMLNEPITETVLLKNYVGGEWIESRGELHDIINPATQKVTFTVPKDC